MLKANIETFLACDASYEEAGIVLYGAPFDSTTSYRPGTRFGSRAIRSESYGLESYSPYQDRDLTDYAVFDAGDQLWRRIVGVKGSAGTGGGGCRGWQDTIYAGRRAPGDAGTGAGAGREISGSAYHPF